MRHPRHLKPIIVTAFHTGMRMNELLGLKWSYVDLKTAMIKLPREAVKTESSARRIPINHHVRRALNGLPRVRHQEFVFTYLGRPIGSKGILGSFRTACSKAKVPYGRKTENGFTFHDIRRTVKTNMLTSGMRKTYRDLCRPRTDRYGHPLYCAFGRAAYRGHGGLHQVD